MKARKPEQDVKKQPQAGKPAVRRDWYDPMNFPLIVNRYL